VKEASIFVLDSSKSSTYPRGYVSGFDSFAASLDDLFGEPVPALLLRGTRLRMLHGASFPNPLLLSKDSLVDPLLRASNEHVSIMLLPSLLVFHSRGMAPVLVPLRPSSEALLRARAPGARE
jgi:hypothetical protein